MIRSLLDQGDRLLICCCRIASVREVTARCVSTTSELNGLDAEAEHVSDAACHA